VKFLSSRGAEIDTQNHFGDTPLVDAAGLGYLDMCRFLIENGADFRHVNDHDGGSAFSKAASNDKTEVLSYLLSLLPPEEDVNSLFSDVDAEMVLEHNKGSSELLVFRGLSKRWNDE